MINKDENIKKLTEEEMEKVAGGVTNPDNSEVVEMPGSPLKGTKGGNG